MESAPQRGAIFVKIAIAEGDGPVVFARSMSRSWQGSARRIERVHSHHEKEAI